MALTQITSEGIKDDEVKTADILNANVTTAKLADGSVTGPKLATESVSTVKIEDGAVTAGKLAADVISADKIADGAINSEHYTTGSINTAHIGSDQITGDLIADDAVGAEHIEVLDAALQFGDSVKAQFGVGNDLQIYHNGTYSYITNSTGFLEFRSADYIWDSADGTATYMKAMGGGAVELYYDGSKEFQTVANGIELTSDTSASGTEQTIYLSPTTTTDRSRSCSISGLNTDGNNNQALVFKTSAADTPAERLRITHGGEVRVPDNGKFSAGAGDDLQIYHDASHSWIKNTTGNTVIHTGTGTFKVWSDGNEEMIDAAAGGGVKLYHNDSTKFETISTGVNVTGGIRLGGNNADNELADYEEGTWTPNPLFDSSDAGETAETNGGIQGHYTKIGRLVYIHFSVNFNSRSGSVSGTFGLDNLPFAISANSWNEDGGLLHYYTGVSSPASPAYLRCENTNKIRFSQASTAIRDNAVTDWTDSWSSNEIGTGTIRLRGSLTYHTDA